MEHPLIGRRSAATLRERKLLTYDEWWKWRRDQPERGLCKCWVCYGRYANEYASAPAESKAATDSTGKPISERTLAELARDLVEVVAMEHRALREGFHNPFHMTAVDAACLRVEAKLEEGVI